MKPEEVYHNVSHTQLSIARFYGGIKINGVYYEYNSDTDQLIREDIVKRDAKFLAAEKRKWKKIAKYFQTDLDKQYDLTGEARS